MGLHSLANVNERAFASRRVPAAERALLPDRPDDDALASVAVEFGRLLAADGLMVEHRSADGVLALILKSGDCPGAGRASATPWSTVLGEHVSATERGKAGPAILSATVPVPDGELRITTFFRALSAKARKRAAQLLGRVLPMLDSIVRLWTVRRSLLQRTRALMAAVDQTSVGLLLIDGAGEIAFANRQAQRLLGEGDGVCRSGDRIRAASLQDTMRLQRLIEQAVTVAAQPSAAAADDIPAVALKRKSRRPLIASAIGIGQAQQSQTDSVVVVHLIDPEEDLAPLLAPACHMYGLSPVESRLTCLLADGKTLAAAAEALGIRELTARGYLKQVFSKTGTTRQAELMLLMLKSAVRASPELNANRWARLP